MQPKAVCFIDNRLVLISIFQLNWYINPDILLSAYKQVLCRVKINNFLNSNSSTYSFSDRLPLGNSLKSIIKLYISCLPFLGSAPKLLSLYQLLYFTQKSPKIWTSGSLKYKVFLYHHIERKNTWTENVGHFFNHWLTGSSCLRFTILPEVPWMSTWLYIRSICYHIKII